MKTLSDMADKVMQSPLQEVQATFDATQGLVSRTLALASKLAGHMPLSSQVEKTDAPPALPPGLLPATGMVAVLQRDRIAEALEALDAIERLLP